MKNIIHKNLKNVGYILIALGLLPFVFAVFSGIYNSIVGFSGLCIMECTDVHGISAFMDWILLFSFIYWPLYLVGVILIVIGIIIVKKQKR